MVLTGEPAYLRCRGIKATIPVKDDQVRYRRARGRRGGRPPFFDAEAHKGRNVVERCSNALRHKRGVVPYDKPTVRFRTTIRVANIDRCLKRLS
ncbi:transposase IS4 family protein [Corynebacterium halotolerans YIM 70093 = DSM 44683]|uniref:Transposase IS4 family protein n=1 Tax=Corynebacterium halotolerans YIM 70093 = DSM 44683 TaxID=1121362 RepID=M1MXF8_9CORY|nr:transposase IS4 family protein [Corynebacterium halotolerans YIM 70093 = DSM 44683]